MLSRQSSLASCTQSRGQTGEVQLGTELEDSLGNGFGLGLGLPGGPARENDLERDVVD